MHTITRIAAQGDVLFLKVEAVPPEATPQAPDEQNRHVVAHSETGHHHALVADGVTMFQEPADPLVCYLRIDAEHADVVHHRPWDTHATVQLPKGTWMVRRQREHTPEGWRRVED